MVVSHDTYDASILSASSLALTTFNLYASHHTMQKVRPLGKNKDLYIADSFRLYLQSKDFIILVTVNQETLDLRHPSQLLNNMWFCMYMCVCLSVVTQMCVGSECILLCGVKGKTKMSFLRSHQLGIWNRISQMSWNSQILLGELVSVSFLGIFFSASLVLGWTHRQPQETFPADSGGHTQVFCR